MTSLPPPGSPPDSQPTVGRGRGWLVAAVVGIFSVVVTVPWLLADGNDALGAPATATSSSTEQRPGSQTSPEPDSARSPQASRAAPVALARLPNPAAAAATAMVDGIYRCYVGTGTGTGTGTATGTGTGTNPAAQVDPLGDLLDVRPETGWYMWDGQPGTYVMTRSSLSRGEDVWGDVAFQTGPLRDVKAQSSASFPDPSSGIASEAVVLFQDGSGRRCVASG